MTDCHVVRNNYLCNETIKFIMQREDVSSRVKAALVRNFNLINEAQVTEKIEQAVLSYYNLSLDDLKYKGEEDAVYDAYVYVYLDPTKEGSWHIYGDEYVEHKPLYVGKGTGNRGESHLTYTQNSELDGAISSLRKRGLTPIIKLYNNGCTTAMAFNLENYIIARLREQKVKLCNATAQSDSNLYNKNIIVTTFNLDKLESLLVLDALNNGKGNGSRKEAASLLGISERTLYRKMKSLNIGLHCGIYAFIDKVSVTAQVDCIGMEVDMPTIETKNKKK